MLYLNAVERGLLAQSTDGALVEVAIRREIAERRDIYKIWDLVATHHSLHLAAGCTQDDSTAIQRIRPSVIRESPSYARSILPDIAVVPEPHFDLPR